MMDHSHLSRATLACALAVTACANPTSPAAPTSEASRSSTAPLPAATLANWRADAVVVSRAGDTTCGWGTREGETRTNVLWRVTVSGDSITLEEDMDNWPTDHISFSGPLRGTGFDVTYDNGSDYLAWACQFKGATLTGRFSADFSTFEADETLTWGPPGAEAVVRRHWLGRRF